MLEVDPQLAKLLSMVPFGTIDSETIATLRSAGLGAPVVLSDAVERRDQVVPGDPDVYPDPPAVGAKGDLPVCTPSTGRFVLGSYDMDDARLTYGAEVLLRRVSVQYRLAPETSFPGPLDDCYRASNGFMTTPRLGIDPSRIGVAGERRRWFGGRAGVAGA